MNVNKLGVSTIVVVAISILIAGSLVPVVGNVVGSAVGVYENVATSTEWNEGTLNNLVVIDNVNNQDDVLALGGSTTQGSYISEEFIYNDPVNISQFGIGTMISNSTNSSLVATVKTSDDGFKTVKSSVTKELVNGGNELDVSNMEAKGWKFNISFSRDSSTVDSPMVVNSEFGGKRNAPLLGLMVMVFILGFLFYVYSMLFK